MLNQGRFWGLSAAFALTACATSNPSIHAPATLSQQNAIQRQTIPNEIVVRLKPKTSPQAYAQAHQLQLKYKIGLGMYVFQGKSPLNSLKQDPNTLFAEPNFKLQLPSLNTRPAPTPSRSIRSDLPNDPLIPAQYNFTITGTDKIWKSHPGRPDVIIAVIDSGIDASHPEFEGQLVPGWDFTLKEPGVGGHIDGYGHGTHVAGVIGAKRNNGIGIAGLAPGCKLMPVRIFNNWGHSESGRSAAAVIWAVDHGAKVINASWGSPMLGDTSKAAYEYAIKNDVVFVAAAGNSGNNDPKYPGAVDEAIGVSATNWDDRWASFSTFGDWVDLAAPGANVLSTFPMSKGNGYKIMDGTSMAAPAVTAAAALVRSAHPDWNVAQVRAQLEKTAKDVIMNGKDKYSGFGRVDIGKALLE